MRFPRSSKPLLAVLWAAALVCLCGPAHARQGAQLKIVATTSLIAEIDADLGGNALQIATLVPPAACPGHFDIKPDDFVVHRSPPGLGRPLSISPF